MTSQVCVRNVEFRAADPEGAGADGRTLEGYAAVFNQDTEINSGLEGHFVERVSPGAFKKSLNERKSVVMQFNHGQDTRVGSCPIGVYTELREDENGLYVQGRLFDNPVVEPVRQAIDGGAVTGMSFKFRVVRDEWRDTFGKLVKPNELYRLLFEPGDRGPLRRNVKEVQLFEAGPVVTPAYAGTSVGLRSLADVSDEDREALVAEYRRSMVEDEVDVDTQRWLDAETGWRSACNEWLRAETSWLTRLAVWLEVETAHKTSVDAARKGTSTDPEDAALSGTSHREQKKESKTPESRGITPPPTRKVKAVMNIVELRAREEELRASLVSIGEEHRDADLPAEVQAEWDSAEAELGTVRSQIQTIEARMEKLKSYAVSTPKATERGNSNGTPAFHKAPENLYDLSEIRSAARSEEDYRDRLRDAAMRANDAARFSRAVKSDEARGRVAELLDTVDGEKGELAQRLLVTGSPLYERAFGKAMKACSTAGLSNEEQRALSIGTDSEGGFAVPFQLDPTVILTNAGTASALRSISRVETITGKTWQGITSAGITVTRSNEAAAATDNSPTLARPEVKAERVFGFVPFSFEADQDWGGLRSEMTRMLADAKDREEAASFTIGTGVAPQANGVVTTLTGNTVNTTGATLVFSAGDPYALENALAPRFRANASFLANRSVYNAIRQFDTAGGAQMWERIGAGLPSQLLGYNAYEASDMQAITSPLVAGQKLLLFGDFSNFLIVDKVGMSVELVPHLFDTTNNRPTGQRGITAFWRNNSKILVDAAFKLLVVD